MSVKLEQKIYEKFTINWSKEKINIPSSHIIISHVTDGATGTADHITLMRLSVLFNSPAHNVSGGDEGKVVVEGKGDGESVTGRTGANGRTAQRL